MNPPSNGEVPYTLRKRDGIFVFYSDGKIHLCLVSTPGIFHDITMVDYGLCEGVEKVYDAIGGKFVVESAFNIGKKP